jgi:hypothetical protein
MRREMGGNMGAERCEDERNTAIFRKQCLNKTTGKAKNNLLNYDADRQTDAKTV